MYEAGEDVVLLGFDLVDKRVEGNWVLIDCGQKRTEVEQLKDPSIVFRCGGRVVERLCHMHLPAQGPRL